MPPKTPKKLLSQTLNGLSDVDYKSFCQELLDRDQNPKVYLNQIEGKSRPEVVSVMVNTFTEKAVLAVAVEVLREAELNNPADKLENEAGPLSPTVGAVLQSPVVGAGVQISAVGGGLQSPAASAAPAVGSPDAEEAGAPSSAVGSTVEKHFMDKHRNELIQKVKCVETILDELYTEEVIMPEEYNVIKNKPKPQDKMRAILDAGPVRYSRTCKDILYRILKEHQSYLIDDLEEK